MHYRGKTKHFVHTLQRRIRGLVMDEIVLDLNISLKRQYFENSATSIFLLTITPVTYGKWCMAAIPSVSI